MDILSLCLLCIFALAVFCMLRTWRTWRNNGDQGSFIPVLAVAFLKSSGPVLFVGGSPSGVAYQYAAPVLRALCEISGRALKTVTSPLDLTATSDTYGLAVVTVSVQSIDLADLTKTAAMVLIPDISKCVDASLSGVFVQSFPQYVPIPAVLSRTRILLTIE